MKITAYHLLTASLLLLPFFINAQPKGYVKQSSLPRSLQRIEFGFTTANSASDFEGTFKSTKDGRYQEDYYSGPSITKGGLGVTVGTFYRLALIGKNTAIAADVNFMYNKMNWIIGKDFFIDNSWTISGKSNQFALPIGLSLKFGCDARLEKNHRFCASFGAGILPSVTTTVLPFTDSSKVKFKKLYATPYIKLEAGIFARICWKLRFIYSWGDMPYVDDAYTIGKANNRAIEHYNNTGKSSAMLSVIIMPFSWDWPDNGWWNNSRTSKKMY